MENLKLSPLVLALTLALTACGGGSEGGDDNTATGTGTGTDTSTATDTGTETDTGTDTDTDTGVRVSLTGLAVKGVLANATITVTNLAGDVEYGGTTTNAQGRYSLDELEIPSDVPVKVTMTTNADTTVKCDAAGGCSWNGNSYSFGDVYSYNNASFRLTAVLPSYGADTAKELMVTPVTHLAAERASAAGSTTPAQIAATNAATATMLGLENVDITNTSPSDITDASASGDSSASQRYGAIVSAIATVASERGEDISDVVNELAADYSDGGLTANASDDSDVIDLEEIFTGAAESASAAEDSGVNLGATEAEFSQDALEASAEEEDAEVTVDVVVEEEVEDEAAAQALAVENSVNLLLELNEWSEALQNAEATVTGETFTAQAEELEALVPTFEEQSDLIRGVNELMLTEYEDAEGDCYTDYIYDDSLGGYTYETVCYPETVTEPGPLFGATDVMMATIGWASYVQENGEELLANGIITETGTTDEYSISLADMLDQDDDGYVDMEYFVAGQGSLEDFIVDEETEMLASDITMTFTVDADGFIITAALEGTNADGSVELSSGNLTRSLTDTAISYSADNFQLSSTDGLSYTGGATASMEFDSATALQDVLATNDPDLASIASISASLTGSMTGWDGVDTTTGVAEDGFYQASADINLAVTVTQDEEGSVVLDANMDLSASNDNDEAINGTFKVAATGTASEVDMGDGYLEPMLSLDSMTMGFEGSMRLVNSNGDVAEFSGSVAEEATDTDGDSALSIVTSFSGELAVAGTNTASFTGDFSLTEEALMDSTGEAVYYYDEPYMLPTKAVVNGTFTATASGLTAVALDLTATLTMGYDSLADLINGNYTFPDWDNYESLDLLSFYVPQDYALSTTSITDGNLEDHTVYVVDFSSDLVDQLTVMANETLPSYGLTNIGVGFGGSAYNRVGLEPGGCVLLDITEYECVVYVVDLDSLEYGEYYTSSTNYYYPAADLADEALVQMALEESYFSLSGYYSIEVYSDQGEFGLSANYTTTTTDLLAADADLEVVSYLSWSDPNDPLENIEETEDNFVEMAAVLDITGEAITLDDAHVRLVATRLGLEDASGRVVLSYGDRKITINLNSLTGFSDTTANRIVITNGTTTMTLTASCSTATTDTDLGECESGVEYGGTITSGGYEVGSLEVRSGIPVFVFDDGTEYDLVITPQFLISAAAAN